MFRRRKIYGEEKVRAKEQSGPSARGVSFAKARKKGSRKCTEESGILLREPQQHALT